MVARRPAIHYQILIALLATSMTWVLLTPLSDFWKMTVPPLHLILYAVAATAYGWLIWRAPRAGLLLLLLGLISLFPAAHYLPKWAGLLQQLGVDWRDFLVNLREEQLNASFSPAIGHMLLVGTAVGTAALTLREALSKGSAFWSIGIGTAIFGTEWAWYYDRSTEYFLPYALMAFAIWTLGRAARRDAHWEGSGRKIGYRSQVFVPLVTVVAVAVVASALPSQAAPLDLGLWGERAQRAFPVLKRMRGPGVGTNGPFSLAATGFSPGGSTLGGPVKLSHATALDLTVDGPLRATAYLRGATYLTYDGKAWLPNDAKYAAVAEGGSLPSDLAADVPRERSTLTIAPTITFGSTLFGMLEPVRVEGLKSAFSANADSDLKAEKSPPKGASYQLIAQVPTYSAEQVRLLSNRQPSEAYDRYLMVPETLPRRVGELARAITRDESHPFDKALALEAWLRGMTYDLSVPAAPPGRDFVDYFLFDLKRGYCTYYSTAMTMMLRELSIPVRLVEGFAVPASSGYSVNSDGTRTYTVVNGQAHAWVEAYFPDYGWVTFDPTPRADLPTIDRSAPAPARATPTAEATSPTTPSDREQQPREFVLPDDPETVAVTPGTRAPVKREWPWALTAVVALAGLGYLAVRRMQSKDRIKATEEGQVVQEAWQKTSSLMALFGSGRQPAQTPQEYAQQVGVRWPSLRDEAITTARDYTAARFGPPDRQVEPGAAVRAKRLWESAQEAIFSRVGWRAYFWRRLRSREKVDD